MLLGFMLSVLMNEDSLRRDGSLFDVLAASGLFSRVEDVLNFGWLFEPRDICSNFSIIDFGALLSLCALVFFVGPFELFGRELDGFWLCGRLGLVFPLVYFGGQLVQSFSSLDERLTQVVEVLFVSAHFGTANFSGLC
ncbi:hypothetical protein BpHYR1_044712 [Brachionus plicatilis]|uniref:Uncharacterized protein n=1 Tax=Brachionus plicatilis TaxID=10195 RepID=A0A3M7Q7Y4_BRAPC|nr:hypothetical protein BpHYR1_044712 [Brachionus plicatilis]